MLDRLFGEDGFFGAGAWWIIVLFFLFLAFGESWVDIDIMAWIPFLILLLITCSCGGFFGEEDVAASRTLIFVIRLNSKLNLCSRGCCVQLRNNLFTF